ncbi:unnamed protein product [Clonostachys byssicola]|uniref:Zn(2)-C6 fungal-type domain-containing protein n=1 Tax=Clonostachys byssicola TaxID=160290 RepID=A0A9N9XVD6_9HYPO|nr:unnamed protein product [Clonostachys byssicola]
MNPPPATTRISGTRKRAPKACLGCRARKVRCDAAVRGVPCSEEDQDGDLTIYFVTYTNNTD